MFYFTTCMMTYLRYISHPHFDLEIPVGGVMAVDPDLSYCRYFWEALFEQVLPSWAATRAATSAGEGGFFPVGVKVMRSVVVGVGVEIASDIE